MNFNRENFTDSELKDIFIKILKPRLIEEKMLVLLRQGRISKWFSGYGQEAISVGATLAMNEDEYVLPMHRNLGLFTTRGVAFDRLFSQFQGKANGFTKGRDRSFHFGSKDHKIVGMISHLGPQLGVADGIALASLLSAEKQATLVFTGDGGASEGDFHEAINVAAVWSLPVIFLVENNQWGLSTPSNEQFKCKQFVDKAIGYGIDAEKVDGNNILEVIESVRYWSNRLRENPAPVLIECVSFRMRGHEEASGTKYYPEGLQEKWALLDPVSNFESFLINEKIVDENWVLQQKGNIKAQINTSLDEVFAEEEITFDKNKELTDVYAPFEYVHKEADLKEPKKSMRMIDAISNALDLAMQKHDRLVLMGQDIAEYGGVFKITDGFVAKYGKHRVRNTPLCESAIVGASLGLSIKGYKAMMEMQFADFVTSGYTQIVNNVAKIHWRWGQNADVVIRMPTGGGVGAGPFHSQSTEAWFTHTPGLKVVYPAFAEDAKGLLLTAFEDPNPVMFFEHKALYRSNYQDVSESYFTLPMGVARTVKQGSALSIITYGLGVHWALKYAEENQDKDIEIIDLRTLVPLDKEAIYASVKKTGKVIVLHEACEGSGFGAEIAALISHHCFEYLDAPVIRVASLDTPVPFAKNLENGFMAQAALAPAIEKLYNY